MANVLLRRLINRNILKLKKSSCMFLPCTQNLTTQFDLEKGKLLSFNKKITVLSPKCISIKYYSDKPQNFEDYRNVGSKKEEKVKKLSLYQRLKQMYRDYWYVLVPVHLVTSAAWFGGLYYLSKSGVDIPAILESWDVSESITCRLRDSSMGYLAVTFALYKVVAPARYAVTLGGTTLSINYLKKWGYIKPVPSKERLKEMIQEKKDDIIHKSDNLKEKYHERKDDLIHKSESLKEKYFGKK